MLTYAVAEYAPHKQAYVAIEDFGSVEELVRLI
jgi:hypothetical protein